MQNVRIIWHDEGWEIVKGRIEAHEATQWAEEGEIVIVARHRDTGAIHGLQFDFSIVEIDEVGRWEELADLGDYCTTEADGWPSDSKIRELASSGHIRAAEAVYDLPGGSKLGAVMI